ncbi:MAG: hypothetical protein MJ075_06200, partial [Oscillospiraceae bacterium]|nr:hypothetical protein [Oscillospiraceae bacterium]
QVRTMRMRKKAILILAISALMFAICYFGQISIESKKYPSGRDTIRSFGNGTFQLLRSNVYGTKGKVLYMCNEINTCIIGDVQAIREQGNSVVVIGSPYKDYSGNEKVCVVIDLSNNVMEYCVWPSCNQRNRFILYADKMSEAGCAVFYESVFDFSEEKQQIIQELLQQLD